MSTGSNPQVDVRMLEETRRHINRLIEEVSRLSEAQISPSEYFAELLKRVLAAMAAPAGAVWTRTAQGNLQLAFQVNMREVGLDRGEDIKRRHDELLRHAVLNPQPLHLLPHSGAGGDNGNAPVASNPTEYLLLLVPILLNNEVTGLIEVWQSPERPLNAVPGFLQFISTMADLAARFMRNQLIGQMAGQQQVWTQLEAFARHAHGSLHPTEVAYHVANEGRRLIDCDRVSVGVRHGRKVKVEAVSGSDVVERRSNLIVLMRRLMRAVIRWGEKLVYSGTKDDSLPPAVLHALDAYLAESNSKLLVLTPLRDEREAESKRPARSVLLMECFEPAAEPQQLLARLDVVSRHAAPALYNAVEYRRIPMRFLWVPMAKVQEGLGGKARAIMILVLVLLGAAGGLLYFVQYPLKMEAKGQLLPITRAYVYSPEKGRVTRIEVNPGDTVAPGQNLLQLYSAELRSQAAGLEIEIASADEDRRMRENNQDRPNSNRPDVLAGLNNARARLKVLQAQQEALFARYNAVRGEPGTFYVKAPRFTSEDDSRRQEWIQRHKLPVPLAGRWRVLSTDFPEKLRNKPVDPSMPLLRLGDEAGGWEIEIQIPQQNIHHIMRAFDKVGSDRLWVDLLARREPTHTYKGLLFKDRIGGEAVPQANDMNEPEPVVTAYVVIDHPDIPKEERLPRELLLTGTEVLTKVRCGDERLGYCLFYGVWEFFCEKVLFAF